MAPKTPPAAPASQPAKIDVSALLASLPTGAAGGTTDFLGLPANSASPSAAMAADQAAQASWAQGQRAAAYANGAQMMPVYQSWQPQDIDNLQRRLINVGLLDTNYQKGVWDASSQKAFTEILGHANNMGSPWQDALANYETGSPMVWDSKTGTFVKATPGTARTRSVVLTNYTSPDDLATTAQGVATAKLGRSFTPQELQKFISAYHGTEKAASDAQAGNQDYTAPASMATAATTFAEQQDPDAYNASKFLPMVDRMNQLLAGPTIKTTTPQSA